MVICFVCRQMILNRDELRSHRLQHWRSISIPGGGSRLILLPFEGEVATHKQRLEHLYARMIRQNQHE